MAKRKDITINKNNVYHIYLSDGRFYLEIYGRENPIIHSYETLAAAKEALLCYFS